MQKSEGRILTTHAGSLPRPPALVDLFVRRARGDTFNQQALAHQIESATRWVVTKQLEAGIDIPNNGEQPREAFFLYVRHRMSGFGGIGSRPPFQDLVRYPGFRAMRERHLANVTAVSNFEPPKVVDEVRYLDPAFVEGECDDFRRVLAAEAPELEEAFVTAPSPGIIAAAVPNGHYDTDEAYIEALATALRTEYEAIVERGFVLQLDCPDLAMERHLSYGERPLADFLGFVETVVAAMNRALENVPRDRVRLHVCWGNYEGPHDCDVPLAEVLPKLLEADVGAFVLPFANPRHAHEYRALAGGVLADDQLL
ncbi:MAG: methionine synthase, partial [Alphaproteobacteria bacterium]|nr:methionine synthase [Alphaproteobacteria bacterium]